MLTSRLAYERETPLLSDRQGFNRRWSAPNLKRVYTPTTTDQVLGSVIHAKRTGIAPSQIQVTCGRHCYENFVYNENTHAIVDTTGLRAIGRHDERGYFVEVGNGNWDMYRTLNNLFGVTLPAGSCYSVGLGGHITGGGYGLLSRLYGLTVDHLSGVEIVTFGETDLPQIVYASETGAYPDLFFALRGGGGGNFGVITRYFFRDPPPAPKMMYANTLTIPWSGLSEKNLGDYLATFAEYECSQDPESWHRFSIFHLNHQEAGALTKSTFTFYDERLHGDQARFERRVAQHHAAQCKRYEAIGPLSRLPGPHIGHPAWLADNSPLQTDDVSLRKYTYLEGTQTLNGSGPNRFGKYKSAHMNKPFPDSQVKAIFNHLQVVPDGVSGSDMAASLVQIDSYGGKINTVGSGATAIPQRAAIMKLQYQTYWDNSSEIGGGDQKQEAAHLRWIRDLYSDVYRSSGGTPDPRKDPTGTVDGCYFNYCDVDLGTNDPGTPNIDDAMYLYFKDNYSRLKDIKKRWNPRDWFRSAQSIPVD